MKAIVIPDFETMVGAHYPSLFKFAASLCGDLEAAIELTQRTFRLVRDRQEAFREPRKTRAWLFTILFSQFLQQRPRTRTRAAAA